MGKGTAKKLFFLVARLLSGGDEGLANKKKELFLKLKKIVKKNVATRPRGKSGITGKT